MTHNSRQIPFVGLRPFDIDDHYWFRGRDQEITALLHKVRNNRFTAVVGAAGTGKSSLVRAGILAPLAEDGFKSIIIKPGSAPIAKLAAALSATVHDDPARDSIKDPLTVARAYHYDTKLRQSVSGLSEISPQLAPEAQQLLLVIDQFEELFRYGEEAQGVEKAAMEEEKHAFVKLLLNVATQSTGRLHVMIIMRLNYFDNCTTYPGFAEALSASQYLVSLPQRNQLDEIIRAPIAGAGGKLDETLLQRLLLDVTGQADSLPTLQHTLRRLWEVAQGEPRWLREQDYYTIGCMTGSIDVKAEQIATGLRDAHKEDFITLERVMKAISTLDEQGRASRRPQKRSVLLGLVTRALGNVKAADDSLSRVLNVLASEEISFIQLSADDDPEIDISHEVLIRSWRRLCGEDRDFKAGWLVEERENDRCWWDLAISAKTRQLGFLADLLHTRQWFNKGKTRPRWNNQFDATWQAVQQFLRHNMAKGIVLTPFILGASALVIITSIVFAWTNYNEKQHQEIETLRQARIEAKATVDYAQNLIESGHTRLGALIALSATPKSRRVDDPRYTDEIGIALTNALARPIEIMRRGHDSLVYSVAFSPDGSRIVSGSSDNMIRLWDANTGEPISEPLRGHDGPVNSVAFSPGGGRIVSGSWDNTLRLWDATTGEAIGEPLAGHKSYVISATFSPDGNRIVSGSWDKTLRLWNADTGNPIGEPLRGHESLVYSAAFSPDGNRIISGSEDKTLRMWDAKTGKAIGEPLHGHKKGVNSIAFSPDGSRIVSGSSDRTLRLWDAKTGEAIGGPLRGHDDTIYSVAFSPDGSRIVSGSEDKTLQLWNANTGEPIGKPLYGHHGPVDSVAFSPNGSYIVSGSSDKTLRLWAAKTNAAIGGPLIGHVSFVYSAAFSPDGGRIVSGSEDKMLRLWDAKTGAAIGEPLRGHDGPISSVAFSPDGSRIISGSMDKTLRLWDAKTGAPIGEPLRGHAQAVLSVAFSSNSSRIISGSADKTLRQWNVGTGDAIGEPLRGHEDGVFSAVFSPDGSRIVSGSADKTLRRWNAKNGAPIGEPLRGHDSGINSVAYSPDGRRIVSGSLDKTLRQWDANTGNVIGGPLRGHDNGVFSVAFSPDGSHIVSGSMDNTLRLWDVKTGASIGDPLHGHDGIVYSVTFSPEGNRIVSGSTDKTLRLWDALIYLTPLEGLVEMAEKLCPLSLSERQQLRLADPTTDASVSPLTLAQRRACGE